MPGGGGEGEGVLLCRVLFPLLMPFVDERGEKLDPTPSVGRLREFGLSRSRADLSVLSKKYSFYEPNTSF